MQTDERAAASDLARQSRALTAPIDLHRIADHCRLRITRWETCPGKIAGLLYRGTFRDEIVVNGRHSLFRRRFTIAHEIGHWYLRHEGALFLLAGERNCRDDQERSSSVFAAELLMPGPLLRAEIPLAHDLRTLCRRFQVSEVALSYQLSDLGLDFPQN